MGSKAPARRARAASLLLALAVVGAAAAASAEGVLRVGTSGDYAPFSFRRSAAPDGVDGLDLAVARAFAEERELALELVRFRWVSLLAELDAGAFDVAMSGVTVRPERSLAGRFTVPVAESGAVLLLADRGRFPDLDTLDSNAVRIGVNAGGHLERVARRRFPRATLVAIRENQAVLPALLKGFVDVVVTDTQEAPHWRAKNPSLGQLGPFTRDHKAYLVRRDRADLARDLDRWLLEREADGTLAALRARYLGEGAGPPSATPLRALAAALEERLALMPLVARAKMREGVAIEVPAREERVVAAAVASAREAAAELGLPEPDPARVATLFRAQIEAAKALQMHERREGGFERARPPALDAELRPALLRIGERMGELVVRLGAERPPPAEEAVREAVAGALRELEERGLEERYARAVADAMVALAGSSQAAASEADERPGDEARHQR